MKYSRRRKKGGIDSRMGNAEKIWWEGRRVQQTWRSEDDKGKGGKAILI